MIDIVDIKKEIRKGEIKVFVKDNKVFNDGNTKIYKQVYLENSCGEKIIIYDELGEWIKEQNNDMH